MIIGDTLRIHYQYEHRTKPHKRHSPRDWVGIFLTDVPSIDETRAGGG